ncbi:MAG: selenocysteine-specific translation elongation factor [Anaerolineales bacterium]|nr:selenocysteine-specific translation elongation factor [Anaerolineales bacterium]MCX7609566.1 selenocysteine-specific translation elongation factor [Anaerolineales bacterium]MDW8226936.1 selenocysteine-specific translation elongation factor [Anaerolineales bacterium]
MYVIGTAGHVDHGKSSLIAALTGTHPDRLKEEQERQMTIDLGFGWLTLPDGQEIGIVDVPGHRDFIGNMLAGVGGLDAVLLIVAADEGVMPQTREHLAILDLLQIPAGLIVLTKIDLIDDPAWLDLVETDVHAAVRGTFLEQAEIIHASSRTGVGLDRLVQSLSRLLQNRPPRPDLGRPRLPIDRVFSMPGFGTVVTGTLLDGQFALGEEVEILPSGLRARIRGLQTHHKKQEIARPGSRTAINLSGIEVGQIRRGEVVVHPGQYQTTRLLDVYFRHLPESSSPLTHHTEVKLFAGSEETLANVRLLGREILPPGTEGWLQLELRRPIVAVRGDHYILRRPSPGETLGGGMIVDPNPKKRHKRFDEAVLRSLEALRSGSPTEVLFETIQALGPVALRDALSRSRLEIALAESALQELIASGQVILLEEIVLSAARWSTLQETARAALTAYHRSYPLRQGMPREELKSKLGLPTHVFNLVLAAFLRKQLLVERQTALSNQPKWLALPEHQVRFSPVQQSAIERLLQRFAAAPYTPPTVKECQALVGEEVFLALLEMGELVQVSPEIVFRRHDYENITQEIQSLIRQRGQITLAEARDHFGTSRKYMQAFLEHLDALGLTVRVGEARKLKEPCVDVLP